MLAEVKKKLLESPEAIRDVLEIYGYAHIKIRENYISFGRDEASSPKSIVIWITNNDYLYVKDYPKNIYKDLFSYIMEERGVSFREVISVVNQCLGITDYSMYYRKRTAFGGFYSKLRRETPTSPPRIYDDSVLDKYERVGNLRFLRDHISLQAQKFFNIRFDVENDGIVIPILDQFGNLIAVKERVNHEVGEDEQKYWYPVPGQASKTLYGYAQNYSFLVEGTAFVFEAEKSVMQCYTFGVRNAVALASGNLSKIQVKMLHELQLKRIVFLHDVGYEMGSILKNVNEYKSFGRFSDTEVGFWDWTKSNYTEKYSPSDLGRNEMERILREEIVYV